MPPKSDNEPSVITAKWGTEIGGDLLHFGTIVLDDEFEIRFPMLASFNEIPFGTTVLWGAADDLKKCTAVTLPFGPPGSTSAQTGGHVFHARSFVRYLLIGDRHIPDPDGQFVRSICFTPQPNNHDLHKRQFKQHIEPLKDILQITFAPSCDSDRKLFATAHFASFIPETSGLFAAIIPSAGMTASAWITPDNCVRFCLNFDNVCQIQTAVDDVLAFCTFLSFIAHQCVYPTDFDVMVTDGPVELRCWGLRAPARQHGTWVRNTLVLPDDTNFGDVLLRWYATNDKSLASRYLYRHSLEKPNLYSAERFLTIFRALEGVIDKSGHAFLAPDELKQAAAAVRRALSGNPKVDALIRKLKSLNTASPSHILKTELRRIFTAALVAPRFNLDEFIDQAYKRRNQLAHGSAHLDNDPTGGLVNDTMTLTAIYLVVESHRLGLDANKALQKFRGNFAWFDIPFFI